MLIYVDLWHTYLGALVSKFAFLILCQLRLLLNIFPGFSLKFFVVFDLIFRQDVPSNWHTR